MQMNLQLARAVLSDTEELPKRRFEALILKGEKPRKWRSKGVSTRLSFEHAGSLDFPCICCMAIKSPWTTLSVKKEMVEQTVPLVGVGFK